MIFSFNTNFLVRMHKDAYEREQGYFSMVLKISNQAQFLTIFVVEEKNHSATKRFRGAASH